MQFLLSNERVTDPIGSQKNTQAIFYLDNISEDRINTEVALLNSNDLLLSVVKKTGMENEVHGSHLSDAQRTDQALTNLRKNLVIAPVKHTAVIRISYAASNPERSVQVLQALSQLYMETHLKVRGGSGSYAFFTQMLTKVGAELEQAQTALNNFKEAHGIVSLPEERTLALQSNAELQRKLADAEAAADSSRSQADKLSTIISAAPQTVIQERRALPNQYEIQQLSTLLTSLQNKRIEATSRYLPEDLMVKNLDDQIAQTKAALNAATRGTSEEVATVANPVVVEARTAAMHAQSLRAGYQAQADELRAKLAASEARLSKMDMRSGDYTTLVDNVNRLTELQREYHQRADTAQANLLLDQNHISDVAVAEQPHASLKPTSPRLVLVLGLGFVWSVVVSVVAAFCVDRWAASHVKEEWAAPSASLASVPAHGRLEGRDAQTSASELPSGAVA